MNYRNSPPPPKNTIRSIQYNQRNWKGGIQGPLLLQRRKIGPSWVVFCLLGGSRTRQRGQLGSGVENQERSPKQSEVEMQRLGTHETRSLFSLIDVHSRPLLFFRLQVTFPNRSVFHWSRPRLCASVWWRPCRRMQVGEKQPQRAELQGAGLEGAGSRRKTLQLKKVWGRTKVLVVVRRFLCSLFLLLLKNMNLEHTRFHFFSWTHVRPPLHGSSPHLSSSTHPHTYAQQTSRLKT